MVVAKMARGVTTRVRLLPLILLPSVLRWNALLAESLKTVNTILTL